ADDMATKAAHPSPGFSEKQFRNTGNQLKRDADSGFGRAAAAPFALFQYGRSAVAALARKHSGGE
ncbi:MAG: hypothetical protein P8X55_09640, partial [Desulfosarcinaceae bacterium]